MTRVLFVCTGNVFRSLTAEYALKQQVGLRGRIHVSSAGTRDAPEISVREDVAAYLMGKGLDVSNHQRRLVNAELLEQTDLVVAMNTDHQKTLQQRHGVKAPLYMEACGQGALPLLDVDDLFARGEWYSPAAIGHIQQIIDQIVAASPALSARLLAGGGGA
ncbi:MAG: hypothetical protein HKN05_12360 [Rhizobiales bacterium]|nr:hypothetical protein [Hyphomicrobiales bacterium]